VAFLPFCPKCKAVVKADEIVPGKAFVCRKCGAYITAVEAEAAPILRPEEPVPRPVAAKPMTDRVTEELPFPESEDSMRLAAAGLVYGLVAGGLAEGAFRLLGAAPARLAPRLWDEVELVQRLGAWWLLAFALVLALCVAIENVMSLRPRRRALLYLFGASVVGLLCGFAATVVDIHLDAVCVELTLFLHRHVAAGRAISHENVLVVANRYALAGAILLSYMVRGAAVGALLGFTLGTYLKSLRKLLGGIFWGAAGGFAGGFAYYPVAILLGRWLGLAPSTRLALSRFALAVLVAEGLFLGLAVGSRRKKRPREKKEKRSARRRPKPAKKREEPDPGKPQEPAP